ncbi:MAG: DUF5979 domain-containing protein [Actinophytocola sp.]|uniref:DUF5979 domain-containing protein n=1 Tax=Actinophytocola sp. TaxID=1872138 RepID=UPI003C709667
MATQSWVRRLAAVLVSAVLASGLPVVTSPAFAAAQDPVCPSPGQMPPPTGTTPLYTDSNVGVFVGGDLTATNSAAGIEGLLVVGGEAMVMRSPGSLHVGTLAMGSQIVPPPGRDMMIVGGGLGVAEDNLLNIGAGAVDEAGNLLGGNLAVGGTITAIGSIETNNGGIENPSSAADQYATFPNTIATLSSNLASLPGSAGAVAGGWVTFTGDNTMNRQIFTISAADLAGVDAIFFSSIAQGPDGEYPPIIVNVVGGPVTALRPEATFLDGVRIDDVYNPHFGNAAAAIMWNFPAVTDLTVGGTNPVLGSILVPTADSTVTVGTDTYGRVYVGGDLVVSGDGNELHNYPWTGALATACRATTAEATSTATLAKILTPGSFLDYQFNGDGRLARFHGMVRCALPTGEVVTEYFTVRANESLDMEGLPPNATCTVTEDLALTDQDITEGDYVPVGIGEWVWARPVVEVDGVVTNEFTTFEGGQSRIELTNTLLGDFELNKLSNVPWTPEPFKIIWSARNRDGMLQDGYVVNDGETVGDRAPNTAQGTMEVRVGEMGVRPRDPATGRFLTFPVGTEINFDEVFPPPMPGYEFMGMDYWPRPVVIGPNEPHTVVEMHNKYEHRPTVMHFLKTVVGDGAHLVPPNAEFRVDVLVNGAITHTLTISPNNGFTLFMDLFFGDHVQFVESQMPFIPGVVWGPPNWIPGNEFVVDNVEERVTTVMNEARLAETSFQIRKQLVGAGAPLVPSDTTFTVDYTVNGIAADVPLTVTADGTVVNSPVLHHDDVIDFAEATPPAVPGVAWGEIVIDPPTLTLDGDAPPVLVTVTNEAVARTGSFQIQKALAGEGAALVPPDTSFTLEGSVNGVVDPSLPTTILADGTIVTTEGLPEGAVVTYTEVTPPEIDGLVWEGAEISPPSVTIADGETPLITVTNTYSLSPATFQLRKSVTGPGAGLVPGTTAFTVDYWVNGAPAATPLTITADGTVVDAPMLRHGDVLTFAEATPPDVPGVAWGPGTIEPAELTLDAEADPPLVTVTNEALLADAGFGIRKVITGDAAFRFGIPETTEFTVEYTVNGTPAATPLTITADGTIVNGPTLSHGDVLAFTEATPPAVPGVAWGTPTIEPAEIILDAEADPPLVTVTNEATPKAATFQINKAVVGMGGVLVPGTTEFTVDYWVNGAPSDTPLTITADGTVVDAPMLRHGDVIIFAEVVPPRIDGVAWGPVVVGPTELTLDAEVPTPSVLVTNTADLAAVTFQLRKELTGDGMAAVPPDTTFEVRYSVNGTAAAEPLAVLADGTVVDGPDLYHGDVVTFTEVTPPSVPGVTWGQATIEPAELTLDAAADLVPLVTVTNEVALDEASFGVRKAITGTGAGAVPPDTEFPVEYSVNGVPAAEPLTIRADGTVVESPVLRHDDRIMLDETTPPAVPGIVWGTPVIEPSQLILDAETASPQVTVTNEAVLADATFGIRKELTGDGADLVPPDSAFTVTYTVNGTPAATPLTILADGTVVDGPALSHGDVVTFAEVTPPAVPGVAWGTRDITPTTLTLDAEAEPVLVVVTNEAVERTGTFQIQKAVTGSGAGLVPGDTEYVVDYTVNGTPAATPLTLLADGTIVNGPAQLIEGDVVTFEETTPADLPGVEWGGATINPVMITVDPDVETPLVVVTNTYTAKAASFQARKALTGDGSDLVPAGTAFTMSYTVNGAPAPAPLTILADGTVVDGPALSHGDVLAFAEEPPPNVPNVVWGATTIEPAEITLDAETTAPVVTVTNEARPAASELTVVKLDGVSRAPLAGASFDLVLDEADQVYDDVIGSCDTVGADGSCTIGELGFGTYLWVETAAPAGYALPPDPVSAPIVIDASNAGTALPPTTFLDPRLLTTIAVRKIDVDTEKTLAGGVFELRRAIEGDELVGTCTTAEDGVCSIGDLDFGDYYWFEYAAPPGYLLLEGRASPVLTVDAGNAGRTHSITVTNQVLEPALPPGPDTRADDGALPYTGASIAIPVAIGMALLLFGGGLLLVVKRGRRDQNQPGAR